MLIFYLLIPYQYKLHKVSKFVFLCNAEYLMYFVNLTSRNNVNHLISVSTKMVPTVPSKVKHNIQKLLKFHQRGLPSDQFLTQYRVCILFCLYIPFYSLILHPVAREIQFIHIATSRNHFFFNVKIQDPIKGS
jgi:hypothetical protein